MPPRTHLALRLTDAMLQCAAPLSDADVAALQAEFSAEELTELALGVAIFHGMSKILIALGMEPESMPVTVLPTPGSA